MINSCYSVQIFNYSTSAYIPCWKQLGKSAYVDWSNGLDVVVIVKRMNNKPYRQFDYNFRDKANTYGGYI